MAEAKSRLGAWLSEWLDSFSVMSDWKDSEHVWRFQERFGVRKTAVPDAPKSAPSESFVCVDEDAIYKRPQNSALSLRRRSKRLAEAEAAKKAANDGDNNSGSTNSLNDPALVSSSGYSSGAGNYDHDYDSEGKSVIRYKYVISYYFQNI